MRGHEDATPRIKAYIRQYFRDLYETTSCSVLLEKTPSNCLRVPFVLEIFPEAKFIHLVRDGRDVARSAAIEWRGGKEFADNPNQGLAERLKSGITMLQREVRRRRMLTTLHPLQISYYAARAGERLFARLSGEGQLWGPRIPRLKEIRDRHSLEETCAIQWRECVERVADAWSEIAPERRLEVRYEDLLSEPKGVIDRVLEFIDLTPSDSVAARLKMIDSDNRQKWRSEMTESQLKEITRLIGPTLERVGYY